MSGITQQVEREDRTDRTGTEVVLRGGPADFPAEMRVHSLLNDADKVKIPHYGGYEHFERTAGPVDENGRPIFEWTGRTRIAE